MTKTWAVEMLAVSTPKVTVEKLLNTYAWDGWELFTVILIPADEAHEPWLYYYWFRGEEP